MKSFSRLLAASLVCAAFPVLAQNLAVVNGKPVPSSRVNAFVEQLQSSGRPVDEAARAQIKEELITREVFAQEAQKRGLKATDGYKNQMELASQGVLIRELFTDFQKKNPVTDAEIKAEYDKFAKSSSGKEYRARHILVEDEAKAKTLIADLKKGAKFEDLAKKESKDAGSGANGGDLDWAAPSTYVPEFSDALTKLKKGELTSAPVKSQFGWHIIRLDDVREAKVPALSELKDQIQQFLAQQKLQVFQKQLREKAKIQ